MSAPNPVIVVRREPTRQNGFSSPEHMVITRAQSPVIGDYANPRNKVFDSDFFQQGKPFERPGVHINRYTAIPQLNSIAEKFWGFVRRPLPVHAMSTPRGRHNPGAGAIAVNVETPEPTTFGSFATYMGNYNQRLVHQNYMDR